MSVSLYTTFGNEVSYEINKGVLTAYLENATIDFPLPEASSTILSELMVDDEINPQEFDVVYTKLQKIGFKEANAKAMSQILIKVAKDQGVNPLTYFDNNDTALKFTQDAYSAMNLLRPIGNRIGLVKPKKNVDSPVNTFIRP